MNIPEDILKVKQEIDSEFFGADPSWIRGENNLPNQAQSRYSAPDDREWRNRSQFSLPTDERSCEAVKEKDFGGPFDPRQQGVNQYNQEQLNSQFSKAQIPSNQGVYLSNLVTEHALGNMMGKNSGMELTRSVPGVFFFYDLSPNSESSEQKKILILI